MFSCSFATVNSCIYLWAAPTIDSYFIPCFIFCRQVFIMSSTASTIRTNCWHYPDRQCEMSVQLVFKIWEQNLVIPLDHFQFTGSYEVVIFVIVNSHLLWGNNKKKISYFYLMVELPLLLSLKTCSLRLGLFLVLIQLTVRSKLHYTILRWRLYTANSLSK